MVKRYASRYVDLLGKFVLNLSPETILAACGFAGGGSYTPAFVEFQPTVANVWQGEETPRQMFLKEEELALLSSASEEIELLFAAPKKDLAYSNIPNEFKAFNSIGGSKIYAVKNGDTIKIYGYGDSGTSTLLHYPTLDLQYLAGKYISEVDKRIPIARRL